MKERLYSLRRLRNFNANEYIEKKVAAINKFFSEENLDSAVIGISGGVDSAVVLSLLLKAKEEKDSPIKRVRCLIIPCLQSMAVTGQEEATRHALRLVQKPFSDCEYVIADIGTAVNSIAEQFATATSWSIGQMVPIMRTSVLYFHAALLQEEGLRSVVTGTINKSEGSYIGFWGKYSDGAVDCQIISDIYKHEVFHVAEYLGVDKEIVRRIPCGDVYSGQTDEELMGIPYKILDSYLILKEFGINIEDIDLDEKELSEFNRCVEIIEKLHSINAHKYKYGKGLAKFLDVIKGSINGGWD